MRIAFLCKRRYMGKDVILDRYARLYEIPFQLARLGHEVRGYCLSYQGHAEGEWAHDAAPGSLHWESRSLGGLRVPEAFGYPRTLLLRLREFGPDVVIGASDIPQIALAAWLARQLGVPLAADLYDNFEGFGQARVPGMVPLLRRAVRQAALITTTSEALKELVRDGYGARGQLLAMPSTIDKAAFHPMDRVACRRALGLPEQARLVGTAGGLLASRGIGTLYAAWPQIAAQYPDAHLVLAGPVDKRLLPPVGPRIHHLGLLAHSQTAMLFNALDVGLIYLADTLFGRYCFPQKAYEMIACRLPIVATAIGAMPHLLSATPACLYRPEEPADLARAVIGQLEDPQVAQVPVDDWAHVIKAMEEQLIAAVQSGSDTGAAGTVPED